MSDVDLEALGAVEAIELLVHFWAGFRVEGVRGSCRGGWTPRLRVGSRRAALCEKRRGGGGGSVRIVVTFTGENTADGQAKNEASGKIIHTKIRICGKTALD